MKVLLAALALAGCNQHSNETEVTSLSDAELFAQAKAALLRSAKDPASMQIGSMYRRRTGWALGNMEVVCGTVNGKNSFGGFTGPKTFAYRPQNGLVLIAGEGTDSMERNAAERWCTL
jgi:hypothetical protein